MDNGIKPVADKKAIHKIFYEILEGKGEATSRDVKEVLRGEGYWATQSKVSPLVREIASEEDIDYNFNGVYRTYVVNSSVRAPKKPVAASVDPIDNPSQGDWEVFDVDGYAKICYYDSGLTAGQAKYQYSKNTGVNFLDVRIRKLL